MLSVTDSWLQVKYIGIGTHVDETLLHNDIYCYGWPIVFIRALCHFPDCDDRGVLLEVHWLCYQHLHTEKRKLQKMAIHILLAILLAIHNSQQSILNRPALGEWTNYTAPVKEDWFCLGHRFCVCLWGLQVITGVINAGGCREMENRSGQ